MLRCQIWAAVLAFTAFAGLTPQVQAKSGPKQSAFVQLLARGKTVTPARAPNRNGILKYLNTEANAFELQIRLRENSLVRSAALLLRQAPALMNRPALYAYRVEVLARQSRILSSEFQRFQSLLTTYSNYAPTQAQVHVLREQRLVSIGAPVYSLVQYVEQTVATPYVPSGG